MQWTLMGSGGVLRGAPTPRIDKFASEDMSGAVFFSESSSYCALFLTTHEPCKYQASV